MMRFYNGAVAQSALYNIGIDCSLNKEIDLSYLFGLVLKYSYKFLADYLSLFLGVGNAFELVKESVLSVYSYEI